MQLKGMDGYCLCLDVRNLNILSSGILEGRLLPAMDSQEPVCSTRAFEKTKALLTSSERRLTRRRHLELNCAAQLQLSCHSSANSLRRKGRIEVHSTS